MRRDEIALEFPVSPCPRVSASVSSPNSRIRPYAGLGDAYVSRADAYSSLAQLVTECDEFSEQANYQQAVETCQRAMAAARALNDQQGEARALNLLGNAYIKLDEYQQAIDYAEQFLKISRENGNRNNEATSLNNLGSVYYFLGEYQKAIGYYEQALKINREIGDRNNESISLNQIGAIYTELGQYEKAIDYHEQSLKINREISDRNNEANALNNLGNAYKSLGEYQKAIDYYEQALKINREIGDRNNEANALNNLGAVYNQLGQYQKSIDYVEQALKINREIGDRSGAASSLGNLGLAYDYLEQYSKAIDYYEQSLKIVQEIGVRPSEANTLGNLGNVHNALGEYQKAIDYYEQALKINREIGDRRGEAIALNNLGLAHRFLEQYQKAINYFEQSLKISHEIGDRNLEALALSNLGSILFEANRLTEAEVYLRQSIEIRESLRLGLSDADKLSLFETLTNPHYILQRVLVAQEKNDEALEIAERSRARAFVELLAQRVAPVEVQNLAQSQVADAITIDQIKQVAHDQNATLVEYSIAASSQLYIWVISPTGDIAFRSVDLSKLETSLSDLATTANSNAAQNTRQTDTTLSLLVQGTRSTINTTSDTRTADSNIPNPLPSISADDPRFTDGLQQLYQLLIDPIQDLLPTDPEAHVIFIPHDKLFLVPFPALQAPDGSYLIQHHTLRTAPSIWVLQLTHQQRQQRQQSIEKALVVGNPTLDLPAARREARAVARRFNTTPLLGKRATKAAVVEQMPDARLIHFAAHAAPTAVDESYGGLIVLADPKAGHSNLTTNEILELKLQAEMVVLSGCNTGVSDIINSDGVVGLARSLMSAGTPSVIMSLWRVPDAPTALLMQKFYQHWRPGSVPWFSVGFRLLSFVALLGVLFLICKSLFRLKLRQLSSVQWRQLPRQFVADWRSRIRQGTAFQLRGRSRSSMHKQRLWQPRALMRSLHRRRWLLAIGLLVHAVVLLSTLQLHPPQPMDKAQALRQAMLTIMKTHPEPRDWAAFTLMGEAE